MEKPNQIQLSETCNEHGFLEDLLGCLVHITGSSAPDSNVNETCVHRVSLAQYTIEEYLAADRMKNSKAEYFAMPQDIYAREILETTLPSYGEGPPRSPFRKHLGTYCEFIALNCVQPWEKILVQNQKLQKRHYCFFVEHLKDWDTNRLWRGTPNDGLAYQTSNDATILKIQYLMAISKESCYALAERLLQEMHPETTLSTILPMAYYDNSYPPGQRSSRTIIGLSWRLTDGIRILSFLIEICGRAMKLSQLLIHLMSAHDHDFTCDDSYDRCLIAQVLHTGADSNYPESGLRPLQIAVQYSDYAAAKILLESGADVNGTGHQGGYSPGHMNTEWWHSSPLHILRNAEYFFRAGGIRNEFQVRRFSLLLCATNACASKAKVRDESREQSSDSHG
jgi:hypothetical protein